MLLEVASVGTSETVGEEGEIWEDLGMGKAFAFISEDLKQELAADEEN